MRNWWAASDEALLRGVCGFEPFHQAVEGFDERAYFVGHALVSDGAQIAPASLREGEGKIVERREAQPHTEPDERCDEGGDDDQRHDQREEQPVREAGPFDEGFREEHGCRRRARRSGNAVCAYTHLLAVDLRVVKAHRILLRECDGRQGNARVARNGRAVGRDDVIENPVVRVGDEDFLRGARQRERRLAVGADLDLLSQRSRGIEERRVVRFRGEPQRERIGRKSADDHDQEHRRNQPPEQLSPQRRPRRFDGLLQACQPACGRSSK